MAEILTFTLAGILVYFISDWLLRKIEQKRNQPFAENRSLVFFAIFLLLALSMFELINRYHPAAQNKAVTPMPTAPADPSLPATPRK